MAYNRKNFLLKVLAVQEIYQQYKEDGVTAKAIYEKYIKDQYHISKSTFDNYLSINAKLELKHLDNEDADNDK